MAGRYTILGRIAKGGMATVYLARMSGSAGFTRLVAIKRLHPELAADKTVVGMLVDEARVAARIRHPNVIDTLDLVVSDGAFSLVLEWIDGESLSTLVDLANAAGEDVPRPIALAIMDGVLRGLDAAHEARSEHGDPLEIVHRDVSPQNVLVGVDGVPRVIDFGVAKAMGRLEATRPGEVRGKFSYMAPEQMLMRPATRQVDVYAAGVVLWELLAGRRLFVADDERTLMAAVIRGAIPRLSDVTAGVPAELDAIVARATARDVGERWLTARELVKALEPFERASNEEVGEWVRRLAAARSAERQRLVLATGGSQDLRTIEDVMNELESEGDGFEMPGPRARAVRPKPRASAVVGLAIGVAIAAVLASIGLNRHRSAVAAPAPSAGAWPDPPPLVVEVRDPSDPVSSATATEPSPSARTEAPMLHRSSAPPRPVTTVRATRKKTPSPPPDPASYR